VADFTSSLLTWYRKSGRHDLPWQEDPSCYRVWVSEIMLQQTQVSTVIPYYQRFMHAFADIRLLAEADIDQVLHLWTGLGYYARARNLHKSAQIVCQDYGGNFPHKLDALMQLPGIGRSTAAAILSLSLNQSHPILDGNVKRVLTRYHAITGWPGAKKIEDQLWKLAEKHTPKLNAGEYTQAIMDLGATLCTRTRPDCQHCPVKAACLAKKQNLQALLPEKKAKKALPVKQTVFAILENAEGEVLLEKRPPSGIWGGLWGFPECSMDQEPSAWLDANKGYAAEIVQEQPVIRHTFSHFHLDIRPVKLKLCATDNRIEDKAKECWYKPDGNLNLGMAAPVKKLMDGLFPTVAGEIK
jgi:A/G-specific adenine glycosylase